MAPTELAKRLRKGAGKGSARDRFAFGLLHFNGEEGIKQDVTTALEWIQSAATLGLAESQRFLGNLYFSGEVLERDTEQAMAWWREAASQDPDDEDEQRKNAIVAARCTLALCYKRDDLCYERDDGVAQDLTLAFEWLQKAAEAGCTDACVNLGDMYMDGRGVEQDQVRAVAEYSRAAGEEGGEGGHALAQLRLGYCLINGYGVEKDDVMSRAWYKRAALRGDKEGMLRAALMCNHG